ncbi:MAG: hypothetical protein ACRDTK_13255 [Mycobacterium sp.]
MANAIAIARAHGRRINIKIVHIVAKTPIRTISSACVEWARPAAVTPIHTAYPIAPATGMKIVASAQYWGDDCFMELNALDLMVNTAFL